MHHRIQQTGTDQNDCHCNYKNAVEGNIDYVRPRGTKYCSIKSRKHNLFT